MSKYDVIPVGQVNTAEVCTCISVGPKYVIATFSSGHVLVHDRRLKASQTFCISDTLFAVTESTSKDTDVAIIAASGGVIKLHPRTGEFINLDSGVHVFASENLRVQPQIDIFGAEEVCLAEGSPYGLYRIEYNASEVDRDYKAQRGQRSQNQAEEHLVVPCGRYIWEMDDDFAISTPEGVFLQLSSQKCLLSQNPREPVYIVDFGIREEEVVAVLSNGQVAFGSIGGEFENFTDFGFKATTVWVGSELYVGGNGALVGGRGVVYNGGDIELVRGDARDTYFAVEGGGVYRIVPVE